MIPCTFSTQSHNHFKYQPCRTCNSYTLGCPNYIPSQQTKPFGCKVITGSTVTESKDLSIRLQTLDESRARDKTADNTRKSPRVEKLVEIQDYETTNGEFGDKGKTASLPSLSGRIESAHCESYSKPVEFRRLSLLEAQLTTRFFLERFYRSQR